MFLQRRGVDFISRKLLILMGFLALQCISFSQSTEPSDPLSNVSLTPDSVTVIADTLNSDLESLIFYDAKDSIIYDAINNRFLLYGNGIVKYDDIELNAGYIIYDLENSEVSAKGVLDTAGVYVQKPVMKQGADVYEPDSLSFNFKSEKAFISNVVTQNGEFYVRSDVTKRDSSEKIYLGKTKITTCDAENPHFHFQVGKAAMVPAVKGKDGKPDKPAKIVTGPVMLKFRKIPTPLALPFGYFPNTDKKTKGILVPSYGNGFGLGYFIRDLGYYLPVNEHLDTRVLVDLYTRGSWAIKNQTTYRKRYRHSGRFNLSYSKIKNGFKGFTDYTESADFLVDWSHTLDSKAIPDFRFSSSVRVGTSTNFRNNLNSSQTNFLTNTYSSSINTSLTNRSILGVPSSITANLRHSQNTSTRKVSLTLPQVTLQMNRAYPFKSNKVGAKSHIQKAIDGIGITNTGNFEMRAVIDESDIRLNNLGALQDQFRGGYKHQFNASTSVKALKGKVSINPSLAFSSNIYAKIKQLSLDPESLETREDTLNQLNATYNWSTGVSANSKIFGTFVFRNAKKIKAIRHTMTPSMGFSFRPVTGREEFGFVGADGVATYYDPADFGIFGSASNYDRQGNLRFGLINNLEMKVADGKGGTKKVSLLDRLSLSTSKNLAADSVKWGNLALSAGTRVGKLFNINYSSSYSFYDQNQENGGVVDQPLLANNKFFIRQINSGGGININLTGDDFKRKTAKPSELEETEELEDQAEEYKDELLDELDRDDFEATNFDVPWDLNLAYTINRRGAWNSVLLKDTFSIRQSVTLNGSISLGENWRFTAQTGLDLTGEKPELTTSRLTLWRDLHCWEFRADIVPFGELKSYTVTLNVKSSMLRDLKINRRGRFGNENGLRG